MCTLLEHLSEEEVWHVPSAQQGCDWGSWGMCNIYLLNSSRRAVEVQDSWFYIDFYLQPFKLGFFAIFSVSYQVLFSTNGFITCWNVAGSVKTQKTDTLFKILCNCKNTIAEVLQAHTQYFDHQTKISN